MVDRNEAQRSSKNHRAAPASPPPKSRSERESRPDRSRAGEKREDQGGVLRELDEVKGQIL